MRIRVRWQHVVFLLGVQVALSASAAKRCRTETLDGRVRVGGAYKAEIGGGLSLLLDPNPNGWRLRIIPANGQAVSPDYAEIATPPYESPNPLLLATEFQFRAQDVLAWNPRHFQYAGDAGSYQRLETAYSQFRQSNKLGLAQAAGAQLAELVSHRAAGTIEIVDAEIEPGVGNQTPAVAVVATHPNRVLETVVQSSKTKRSAQDALDARDARNALGQMISLHVRVRLDLQPGFREKGAQGDLAWSACR